MTKRKSRASDEADLKKEIARRILSLKREDESDAAFARRIGLSSQILNNYRSGRHGAGIDVVRRVVGRARIDPLWLLYGEEAPEPPPIQPHDLEELQGLLARAAGAVREMRARYEAIPPGADEVVREDQRALRQLDAAAGESRPPAEPEDRPRKAQGE